MTNISFYPKLKKTQTKTKKQKQETKKKKKHPKQNKLTKIK